MCEISNTRNSSFKSLFYDCSPVSLYTVNKMQKDRWLLMNGNPRFIQVNLLCSSEHLNVTLLLEFCQELKCVPSKYIISLFMEIQLWDLFLKEIEFILKENVFLQYISLIKSQKFYGVLF